MKLTLGLLSPIFVLWISILITPNSTRVFETFDSFHDCNLDSALVKTPDRHPTLKSPFQIMIDGKPIETFRTGGCYSDYDGDGKRDLVFGSGSTVKVCINSGTDVEPVFDEATDIVLKAGSEIIGRSVAVRQSVQLLDFNQDGHLDILVGPGFATILWGDEDGSFTSQVLNQLDNGQGQRGGNAAKPDGNGETPIKFGEGRPTNFYATDWDLDGDFDVILGTNIGRVILVENIGDSDNMKFSRNCVTLTCESNNIFMRSGTSNPVHADWDGDGKRDLVVGSADGTVCWYKNIGADDNPEFEEGVMLVSPSDGEFIDEPIETGKVSIPFVTDFNGDGQMDLLIGDQKTELGEPKELTDEEQAQLDHLNSEVERIGSEQAKALEDFRVAVRDAEIDSPAFKALFKQMLAEVEEIEDYQNWGLLSRQRAPLMNRSKLTGRIMVYMRKPARK